MSGFQTQALMQPAQAVSGDRASANPIFMYQSGPGGLVAGASGVTVGAFAWVTQATADADYAAATVNSFGAGPVAGFIKRENQALNYNLAVDAGNTIPAGFGIGSLAIGGDFWVTNSGSSVATPGMTVYANLTNGLATAGTAVNTVSGGTTTAGAQIAPATTISCTASISNQVMTVTAVSTGTIVAGATMVGGATGTMVVNQITPLAAGEALGGVGRYIVSIAEQSVASTTFTGSYGVLTLSATFNGAATFPVIGGLLSGTNITNAPVVTQLLTGSPGVAGSTFAVTASVTNAVGTCACTTNVATKWFVTNTAAAGELIKMQDHALG